MKLHEPVPREWIVGGSVALAVIVLIVLVSGGVFQGGRTEESPSPSVSASTNPAAKPKPSVTPGNPELTASSGNYVCAGGKKFTLSVRTDGTARVTGSDSSSGVVLTKTSIGIWTSANGMTVVREIAGYTILVENNVTTRDSCTLKK